jgi:hypothetical protein
LVVVTQLAVLLLLILFYIHIYEGANLVDRHFLTYHYGIERSLGAHVFVILHEIDVLKCRPGLPRCPPVFSLVSLRILFTLFYFITLFSGTLFHTTNFTISLLGFLGFLFLP